MGCIRHLGSAPPHPTGFVRDDSDNRLTAFMDVNVFDHNFLVDGAATQLFERLNLEEKNLHKFNGAIHIRISTFHRMTVLK